MIDTVPTSSGKEEIRAKLDIADVIGEYVQVKPAGSGSFKALCPFHNERTPSFHISRERQIWKCFGCDKGGDIFSFIMEIEGLSFIEALKFLAQKAGVSLPEYQPKDKTQTDKRDTFLALYALAAEYYANILFDQPAGEVARAYVRTRNIGQNLATEFQLGASTDAWDGLARFLRAKGYRDDDLVESGLCLKKRVGEGVIDRFRNRLMIPICDVQGRVIAFTARIIPGAVKEGIDQGGKYINSPETLLYKKGETLFGLHLAKAAIRKQAEVILVEGNLDVIASHKAGVHNVVAVSGTALTEAQLHLLGRFTKRVIFCLDDDAAGFAAAKRALELALSLDTGSSLVKLDVRCLAIPEGLGKDPDEVIQKDPEAWPKLALQSQEAIEYVFQKTLRSMAGEQGALRVEDRTRLIDELLPYIQRLSRSDARYLYLSRLADVTHVPVEVLSQRQKSSLTSTSKTPQPRVLQAVGKDVGVNLSEEDLLLSMMLRDRRFLERVLAVMPIEQFGQPWKTLYAAVKTVYTSLDSSPSDQHQAKQTLFLRIRANLEQSAGQEAVDTFDAATLRADEALAALSPHDVLIEGEKHLARILATRRQSLQRDILSRLREAELQGDTARVVELTKEYQALLRSAS